jgi:hypothetical protein
MRVVIMVVAGVAAFVPQTALAQVRNPANGHHYRVVNVYSPEALTWQSANAAAQTYVHLGVTGHLVTITSAEEMAFVKSLIAPPAPGWATFWIGARFVGPGTGTWQWVTGEPFGYSNWWPSYPGDPSGPSGAVMCNVFNIGIPSDCENGQWFAWGIDASMAWYGGIGFIVEFETSGIPEPPCVAPPIGLSAWWPGNGNALDIVGGHHGSMLGTATFASPALVGDAFRFPAQGDTVRVPNAPALQPASFTVEAWVRAVSPGTFKYIVAKGADGNVGASFALYTGPWETVWFYVRDAAGFRSGALAADSALFWNGDWHHVVGRYDGTSVLVYVDGVAAGGEWALGPINYALPDTDLQIGSYAGLENTTFPGDIDEVALYDRALTGDEIWYLYLNESVRRCNGSGGAPPPAPVSAAAWIGLKNSDDQGTQFDLRAEFYKNDVLLASGELLCVTGVTRNPNAAKEVEVTFSPYAPPTAVPGDTFSVRFLTRIGTTPGGEKCSGPGGSHSNASGLRLYYDSATRPSRLGPLNPLFLHKYETSLVLDASAPTGSAQSQDSAGINFSGGNPWKTIGTWATVSGGGGS